MELRDLAPNNYIEMPLMHWVLRVNSDSLK